jgi:MoaD family protein
MTEATDAPAVTVRVPAALRPACGGAAEIALAAASLRALLADLERRHPAVHRGVCDETGAVRRHVNIFVNEAHVRELAGLDTRLVAGDSVTILPAVSGG